MASMLTLGIETSCDETACAIVQNGQEILSNVVASQITLHEEYGGVVPELACRQHIEVIMPVIHQALQEACISLSEIDLFAVAYGPGLMGALLIGLQTAKTLAFALQKPFVGVNHIEAHLYAALMSTSLPVSFPCIGVVLSGGHTNLVLIKNLGDYAPISQTVDDAIGEAFDKVAKMVKLSYPGGPQIEMLAKKGDKHRYPFKAGQVKGLPLAFSFSGLKTAVLYCLKEITSHAPLSFQEQCDIAASFQRAAFEDIVKKTKQAAALHHIDTILLGGGVTNNQELRSLFQAEKELQCIWPCLGLSLDNAAMIAGLGHHIYQRKGKVSDPWQLEPLTRILF
jgi:N6-L-threonylcarbamoyladenine synthase